MRCHYVAAGNDRERVAGSLSYLNYDVRTQRRLKFEDVFTDSSSVQRALVAQLGPEQPADIGQLMRGFGFSAHGVEFTAQQGSQNYAVTLPYDVANQWLLLPYRDKSRERNDQN